MSSTLYYCQLNSPVGLLTIVASEAGLHEVGFNTPVPKMATHNPNLAAAVQLKEYFNRQRAQFSVKLAPKGTDFQKQVWAALVQVPFGTTTTYGAVAKAIGRKTASRAVGAANGKNPIPIIVPCHRIIGSDGSLTGFAGGLATKRWLLEHEQAQQTLGF